MHGFSAGHPPGAVSTLPPFDEFMKRVQPAKLFGVHSMFRFTSTTLWLQLACNLGELALKADAVVRARIDSATKERATVALGAMGLSVSDAIRMLMLRIADEQRPPFDVKVPTPATIRAMKELNAGKGQRFETPEELLSDLDI